MKEAIPQTEVNAKALGQPVVASIPVKPAQPTNEKFYNVPTSPATNLIMETLIVGKNITDIPRNKKKVSCGTTYEVQKQENTTAHRITMTTHKTHVTIEMADLDKLTVKNNSPAKKLFVFSLIKANEHSIFDGQLTKDSITFPLQDLIEMGFYTSIDAARRGFKSGMDTLTSLKVQGSLTEMNNTTKSIETLEVLFTGANIKRGQCTIFFNHRINWGFITRYFTILPRYYFGLPNKSSDLLYYIFFLARQHAQDIQQKGYFTISFRAIQSRLHLPSDNDITKNPKRDIQTPIEDAIEEIKTTHLSQYGQASEFQLITHYTEGANITDFLDSGYLKVILNGSFATAFIELSSSITKKIEDAVKKSKTRRPRKTTSQSEPHEP